MTIFIKVVDRLSDSFVVSNPDIHIYCSKGVFCITGSYIDAFINWDVDTCIDAMELLSEHQNLIFNVNRADIVFSEDSLGNFDSSF